MALLHGKNAVDYPTMQPFLALLEHCEPFSQARILGNVAL